MPSLLAVSAALAAPALRPFADRPVAWFEYDDHGIFGVPERNDLDGLETTITIRDGLSNEAQRILSVEGAVPARDVNAADEVPCSTWFCARNHLHPLTLAEVAGGPGAPPTLPLLITGGKSAGSALGFRATDALGRKFLVKLDPAEHLGLVTAGEATGNRVFHAAGYNVPGAFVFDFARDDLRLDPKATFLFYGVQRRPLDTTALDEQLAGAARLPDRRFRAVAIPWIGGEILGPLDMLGTREGDPNDRIPHQHRRSLRASLVLYAWLSILDPGPLNTIDTIVNEDGRRFVRHYLIDFSSTFGSATDYVKGPQQEGEYFVEVGRSMAAFFSLGLYRRPFQNRATRAEWERLAGEYPSLGYFPAESFDPDTYRTNRKVPPHVRMTAADAYWGAKIATSFTDAQVHAIVATTGLSPRDATYAEHALVVRRDIIGRRYLRAVAAVERPALEDGQLCFDDLAIMRGYARPAEARYLVAVSDGTGRERAAFERAPTGPRVCLGLGDGSMGADYLIVSIRTRLAGGAGQSDVPVSKAARVHLAWRAAERRFVVVGMERDQ